MEFNSINMLPQNVITSQTSQNSENPMKDVKSDPEIVREDKKMDIHINFENMMMKSDELKNFFYMITGATDLQAVSSDDETGMIVDVIV